MSVQDITPTTSPGTIRDQARGTALGVDPVLSDDDLLQRRPGHWIDRWEPEDPQFWDAVGARTARRNLVFSILSEHIGFSVWVVCSVMVLFVPEPVWASA